jgi:hypothetical protein
MRTTITLDPDVATLLKRAMHERDASFKQVLNDAVRQGMSDRKARPRHRYVPMTVDLGRQLVDLTKANALADELEDLALLEKLITGR